jgi:hypothetical protein
MTKDDSFRKLIEIVEQQRALGKTDDEIIDMLVSSGLTEEKSRKIISILNESKRSSVLEIIRFYLVLAVAGGALSFIGYWFLGEQRFVELSKWYFTASCLFFVLFGVLASIPGKIAAYIRTINGALLFQSSFAMTIAMFLHPGWQSKFFGTGGGWRGQLVSIIGNAIYNLGAGGVGVVFLVLTCVAIILLWADIQRIKNGSYESI